MSVIESSYIVFNTNQYNIGHTHVTLVYTISLHGGKLRLHGIQ